jgi:shikimate kinase/3-dehydroquinate synthase
MEEVEGAGQGGLATTSHSRRAIALIGFMGAGKTTSAIQLARQLGVEAIDADVAIEQRLGHTIAQEFDGAGEAAFRALEEQVLLELLADAADGAVLALGGGAVLSARVRETLAAEHLTVLLDIDAASAWERVRERGSERPLARSQEAFAALHGQRAPLYESIADAILPASGQGVAADAGASLAALRDAPAGTKMLWASAASGSYPVFAGRGLVTEGLIGGGEAARLWPIDRARSRAFCVTDENVDRLYGGRLGDLAGKVAIPAGEAHKTLASAETVWSAMVQAGLTRADHVVALGGGVVGDLAGFCAATYQRGIPHVQVPTTVVAQVDSAYGGKTGVDLPQAKNYIGAYHQPSGVIVDPETLASLPARELSAGWVEVLKTALIAGGELWQRVSSQEPLDQRTIMLCAKTKTDIVRQDERDAGARQMLNLGHTIGHAIETATGYERYLHGEAVGLGLLAALRLSGAADLRDQVRSLMSIRDLPLRLEGAAVDDVVAATRRDKKRLGAEVPFVLLQAPGQAQVGCTVPEADVRAAVAELCG